MAKSKAKTTNGNGAKSSAPATTAQRLGTILKSSRDIMRKDKGLSGDVDRIPVLTWIMFLKFLDDMESMREEEAKLSGKKFKPAIEPPYRWRDWAAKDDGITGDELIAFINQEECRRPDGSKGAGLFAYLRALRGAEGGDRRDVIATVFKGTVNRMINGYLLRDVINKVNGIHFTSSEEIHTLGTFYESMLKEMRDAAGDSGEFYTPRAVVRFMVAVIDPKIGETVLDPACGTGGFLVEAFSHMEKQCKTVQQRRQLQQGTILGNEAKPLPYLLAQMNLLLHGLEAPRVAPGNSLAVPMREIGDKERVDVILTNPPFGGEEERGILGNFPEDKQTAETALLFLQLIMRKLKRAGRGRAAVVIPNGIPLSGDGVATRVRAELLENFNLHTVVRMPDGVFAPYADIPSNIAFFDTSGPTREVWFYEVPLPEGRRKYTKTNPLLFEELQPCLEWWPVRAESERAWRVPVETILQRDAEGRVVSCNLDLKNPNAKASDRHLPPGTLVRGMIEKQHQVTATFEQLLARLGEVDAFQEALAGATEFPLAEIAPLVRRPVEIDQEAEYTEIGVRSFYKGIFHRRTLKGAEYSWQKLFWVEDGDIVFSNIMAWEQAIAVVKPEDHRCVGNHRMLTCCPDRRIVLPGYLAYFFRTQRGFAEIVKASPGTAARNKTLNPRLLESIRVPVPPLAVQVWLEDVQARWSAVQGCLAEAEKGVDAFLPSLLHHLFVRGGTSVGGAFEAIQPKRSASEEARGRRVRAGKSRPGTGVAS